MIGRARQAGRARHVPTVQTWFVERVGGRVQIGGDAPYFVTFQSGAFRGDNAEKGTAQTEIIEVNVGDVRMEEGDSGTRNMIFKVKLVGAGGTMPAPAGGEITVAYETANASAMAGSDYSALAGGMVIFSAGQTEKEITVSVTGDTADEDDETFQFNITSATFAVPGGTTRKFLNAFCPHFKNL